MAYVWVTNTHAHIKICIYIYNLTYVIKCIYIRRMYIYIICRFPAPTRIQVRSYCFSIYPNVGRSKQRWKLLMVKSWGKCRWYAWKLLATQPVSNYHRALRREGRNRWYSICYMLVHALWRKGSNKDSCCWILRAKTGRSVSTILKSSWYGVGLSLGDLVCNS